MARARRLSVRHGAVPIEQWPRYDTDGLDDKHLAGFRRNRLAVTLYLAGASAATIVDKTGIDASQARRLVWRCLREQADGTIAGEAGLVPWRRPQPSQRRKPPPDGERVYGFAYGFSQLLARYPSIEIAMRLALTDRTGQLRPGDPRGYAREAHAAFIQACHAAGLRAPAYPFNTDALARQSVAAYVRRLIAQCPAQTVAGIYGRAAAAGLRSGSGRQRPELAVMERVECDAHLIDMALCVRMRHPCGHDIERKVRRLWVIVLLEVRSRAVLGYCLSLALQPNSQDLLDALHMALSPWRPNPDLAPDWPYSDRAGFPSQIAALRGLGFRELSVDGAKMNLAQGVAERLGALMDAKVTRLQRGTPNDRPYIERFFHTLENSAFHRLRGTTGSHAGDRRRLPDQELVGGGHRLDWRHLPAILDHVIAEYNGTPHSSLGGTSPLEFLAQMTADLHPECRRLTQEAIDSLHCVTLIKRIQGNLAQGRAPFIQHHYARYVDGPLALSYELIGRQVKLRLNVHDARVGQLYTLSGEPLGSVYAAPPWHDMPHSLRLRGLIARQAQARRHHALTHPDPIRTFAALSEAALARGQAAPDGYLALQRGRAGREASPAPRPAAAPTASAGDQAPPNCASAAPADAPCLPARTLPPPRPAAQRNLG